MQLSEFIHYFGFANGCRFYRGLRAAQKLRRAVVNRAPRVERRARPKPPSGEGPI